MGFLTRGAFLVSSAALLVGAALPSSVNSAGAAGYDTGKYIDCSSNLGLCTEVYGAQEVFGHYVGHDEPSVLFYSNKPGAGNRNQWQLILPKDPSPVVTDPTPNNKSWNFQLHPAFWFGMALCNTESYPEVTQADGVTPIPCPANSDSNIKPLAQHPGTAFLELQFYPPGWAPLPAGDSCDATKWCAAMVIWSLSEDPIHGNDLNVACQQSITGGLEYGNLAFVTRDGTTAGHGPAGPLKSNDATFTPNPAKDLFMASGDQIRTRIMDTPAGLSVALDDLTSGQSGSMTASVANGFAQMRFAPPRSSGDRRAGSDCTEIPYAFHPMYSTSSPATRVPWAAHSYNVSFADEIGHFDYCTGPIQGGAQACYPNQTIEGMTGDHSNAEGIARSANPTADDYGCFSAAESTLVRVQGCLATNSGFDGVPYQNLWPGSGPNRAGPFYFSSPLTGTGFNTDFQQAALEADLPRIERDTRQHCDVFNGARCTYYPITDDGQPAAFYPVFQIGHLAGNGGGDAATRASNQNGNGNENGNGNCWWSLGAPNIPGFTTNSFGGTAQQYGPLLPLSYLVPGGGGATETRYNDFQKVFESNPCPASTGSEQR